MIFADRFNVLLKRGKCESIGEKMNLEPFIKEINNKKLNVYGVIVKKDGKIISEHRWRQDNFVQVYSVSKSFTAAAIGIASSEGLLSINDRVLNYFKERDNEKISENFDKLRIKDLLTMSTGHEIGTVDVFYYEKPEKSFEDMFFDSPLMYKRGERFEYNNGATYILSMIIQKVTGMKLRDYLMPRLFEPLNIYNPNWDTCERGYNLGYIGLHLTTEQISRFGQLLLDEGLKDGKVIIPKEYVKEMTSKQVSNDGYWNEPETSNGYGYQVWMNTIKDSYRLDGLYGQFCIVIPSKKTVITITSHEEFAQNDILRVVWDKILPILP